MFAGAVNVLSEPDDNVDGFVSVAIEFPGEPLLFSRRVTDISLFVVVLSFI